MRNGFFPIGAINALGAWRRLFTAANVPASAFVEHQLTAGSIDTDEVAIGEFARQDA